jgi:hypothetical protein
MKYERRFPEAPRMRLPRLRFRIRRIMVWVAIVAVVTAWLVENIDWEWSLFAPSTTIY